VLVKLRPSTALRVAESRANLRPLHDTSPALAAFGAGAEPQWFLADLPDGAETSWDAVHDGVAAQLGLPGSDVLFAEPDIEHDVYRDPHDGLPDPIEPGAGQPFAASGDCEPMGQDTTGGKPVGPRDRFAWHLDDEYTQLRAAHAAVPFTDPRTRIAHVDTGYYRAHVTVPERVLRRLERNFVDHDARRNSAEDPDNRVFLLDNSGHGTGTLGILAGGKGNRDAYLGGAPHAEIVPLRVADRVVLFRTSALARALHYAVDHHCDVLTLSMGGLPTRAWREAVDRAYLSGLCIVAAAGNNFDGLPTRHVVYPARYRRVIAVCGVMADGRPYTGLGNIKIFEGNYGPRHIMRTAMAAYTPNIPWARFRCTNVVRLNGEGTSAATPQVAAAAALWLEKYKHELPRDWRRVEAVRHALFSSAKARDTDPERLGNGILQASRALDVKPDLARPQTAADKDSFAFLRVITGLGMTEAPLREQMFNLELAQRWLVNEDLQKIVPDPDEPQPFGNETLKKVMEAVIEDQGASLALRKHVAARYPVAAGHEVPHTERSARVVPAVLPACDAQPTLQNPPYRRLRVYAADPSLSTRLDSAAIDEVTLAIPWETLAGKGPVGEYLAVEDSDPADTRYQPVDLDDPRLLAQDGWAPSEGNPQFHQQMVYAVAMKTIEHFERALGRPILWRPGAARDEEVFVKRLTIHPHALRQANAYYSPQKLAIEFGYFEIESSSAGDLVPNTRVYTCLSHDIIAHETTHAILDGMQRRFNEPSNADVLAFHEAFADIVALLQHFTIPEILVSAIRQTRGDIEAESMLGRLAIQFGQATGRRGALREAIGTIENGAWKRLAPDPAELLRHLAPHARGAILVAAVFDAFIAIYKVRIADLLRIYTAGTGVLPNGAIHPDLVNRLADEATKAARHVLTMCIRALDYLPPVDVTFFEYLRALVTADSDLVRDDRYNYRVAFVEAFRRRGIYPINLGEPSPDTLRTMSVDTLRWKGFDRASFPAEVQATLQPEYGALIDALERFASACFYLKDRQALFELTRTHRRALQQRLEGAVRAVPGFGKALGLDPAQAFEVHELRHAMRVGPDGKHVPQLVVALTQSTEIAGDAQRGTPPHVFRGGSTLIFDLAAAEIRYVIVKNIDSTHRQARTAAFVREAAADSLRSLFFAPDRPEPFAALHAFAGDGC
jgi:hypothetical protein